MCRLCFTSRPEYSRVINLELINGFFEINYIMTSLVVLCSHQIQLNISKSKAVTDVLSKKLHFVLADLSNTIQKLNEKISFHKRFKACLIS